MSWKRISSIDDLKPYLVAAQVDAINASALGSGQSERFDEVTPSIVARIRTKVASNPQNSVSATPGSVPEECVWIAALLIIEAMQAGIPGLALTEDQVRMLERAEKDLTAIAKGDLAVSAPEDPLTPSPVQNGSGVEIVSKPKRTATRESLSGL
jgi:hypothetical protein